MLIYKIISPNTDLVYVGRTTYTLRQRLWGHRSSYKSWLAGKARLCTSFKVLEHGDYSIVLIEETEDASREGYWIRELNACNLNNGSFDRAAHDKARYEEKKDGILERLREKIPCDHCGRIVNRSSMIPHKRTTICQNTASTE